MTPGNPWVNDIRMHNFRGEMSRIGFPIPQNCRFRRYRNFTIRAAVITFLALCLYEAMQSVGDTPTRRNDFKMKQTPWIEHVQQSQERRKGVIILTSHRSGSTFFGQLFNQRPDVFFHFEPLLPFGYGCAKIDDPLRVEYLTNLFQCNISNQDSLPIDKGSRKQSDFTSANLCLQQNFCFREKSKRMCSEEFCKIPKACWECDPVDSEVASEMCEISHLTAIKVIRICDLMTLKPLLENPSFDIKILHLVRDPRGVLGSRKKLEGKYGFEAIGVTCERMENSLDIGFDPQNTWLDGKYKVIRYEDVCQRPMHIASEIYKFVGLSMTTAMEKWITSNTEGQLNLVGDTRAYKVERKMLKEKLRGRKKLRELIINDPYTTTRNSSATWREWRDNLDFHMVEQVQQDCRTAMHKLKYVPVGTAGELRNDEFNVLGKFCSDRTLPRCSRVTDILFKLT
uniref:Sulfotransferase n=1 Tax=Phallusia mammillata TaxID=59560 RepID=A0A6F9D9W4_9ASCI|nr:carbohydrate sulfotransferase 1 [Phallusia mammillata]